MPIYQKKFQNGGLEVIDQHTAPALDTNNAYVELYNEIIPSGQKVYKGATFGPRADLSSQHNAIFINCTFRAQCKFGDNVIFDHCTFVRCCPKYYREPWSTMGAGCILDSCTLDYVTVPKTALVVNPKIKQASNQGRTNPPSGQYGATVNTTYTGAGQDIHNDTVTPLTTPGPMADVQAEDGLF